MSDDEERLEKKKRRKRSRKNAVEDEAPNDENKKKHTDESISVDQTQDKTPTEQKEESDEQKLKRKRKRKRKSKQASVGGEGTASGTGDEKLKTDKLTSLDLTAYIEGIPFDSTEEDVRDFFVSNGCEDILQLRLPRWQDSGRLRGYGHVVFDSAESRAKAVDELNGMHLGKRFLTIQPPKAPRADTTMGAMNTRNVREQPEGCKTVHVKNLPWDATEDDVREVFQVCGKILDGGVRIARNYNTRESKGFAYVEYKNPEGAHGAVNKAAKPFGMTVKGRPCFVDYDEGSIKGSFKTQDGRMWSRQYKH
jgi:nucleolin